MSTDTPDRPDRSPLADPEKYVWVRLREPVSIKDDGTLTYLVDSAGWGRVPYMHPSQCDHTETMCLNCTSSWERDHFVSFEKPDEVD